MAVNDIYQLTIVQSLHGQKILNVLHYKATQAPSSGTYEAALIQAFGVIAIPSLKAFQSEELNHEALAVQKIWPLPPTHATLDTTYSGPGLIPGDSLPTSVTSVITKVTAFAGRKYRGRVYVAGVPVTSENDSQLQVGDLAVLGAFAENLDNGIGAVGASFQPVLWHRSSNTSDNLIDAVARPILRNQRRRQVGRGQ